MDASRVPTAVGRPPMSRVVIAIVALSLLLSFSGMGRAADTDQAKNPRQEVMQLLKGSAEDFIKHFDKNKDGVLTADELPPFLARNFFEKADANGDGKLDTQEVKALMEVL